MIPTAARTMMLEILAVEKRRGFKIMRIEQVRC
jgi:hypothetical protein